VFHNGILQWLQMNGMKRLLATVHMEAAKRMKSKRDSHRKAGICISCPNRAAPKRTQCPSCLAKCSTKFKKLRAERLANGQCYQCKEPATIGAVCYKHWFVRVASNMHSRSAGKMLQELWEQGTKLCPYTGKALVIGENASCDHVIPISRGGTHDGTNLQWVDAQINRMKTDMTHDEFVQMCKLIASRF